MDRCDPEVELDIDLPSMARVVGHRTLRITDRMPASMLQPVTFDDSEDRPLRRVRMRARTHGDGQ